MRFPKRTASVVLALGVTVTLAACTSATGSTSSADTATAELTSAQSACVEAVRADVEGATADTELVAPTAPLDLAALSGKTVWFITVTMNQFSTDMASGVQAAADAAGVKLSTYDGQGSANRFNEGIEQAISQGAGGIILVGIDPSVVSSSLKDAAAAGIPIQNTLNGDTSDPVPDGMYDNFTSDFTKDGETEAKWALVDSGCTADMVSLYSSSIAVWQKMYDGAKSVFDKYCPEDCSFTGLNIDVANVSTDVGSQLGTALQKDPDVDYVYPVWDSATPFVAPVLAAANSKAKVLSRDGLQVNLDAIVAGDQAMTTAMPPTAWIGWASFDDIAREMTGAPLLGYSIPTRVIDSTNVGDGSASSTFPEFDGYADAFTAAWKG